MNIEVSAKRACAERPSSTSSIAISIPSSRIEQMRPFLSNQWWSYLQTYGNRSRHGYSKGYAYPKMTPQAARRDAWPPGGGLPASDLDFVRAAASRFLRHQRRDHESAVADRAGRHERRAVGRDGEAANEAQLANWTAAIRG